MKMTLNRAVMCSILILMGSLFAQTAWAVTIIGNVTFLGTTSQRTFADRIETTFRVRLKSTCDNDPTPTDRWIHVHKISFVAAPTAPEPSGDISANFRNAYSTLLAALLAGNSVQIDGPGSCTTSPQDANFRQIQIGIFPQ